MNFPYKDRVWGIDRYEGSPTEGQLVVGGSGQMPICLWKKPGARVHEDNLSGALKHRDRVTVRKRQAYDGSWYYFVEADVEHKGVKYHQHGWVSAMLLEKTGKNSLEANEHNPT